MNINGKNNKQLIDVSEHQGVIDWERVRPHIDGAILRCGYGSDCEEQDDSQFKRNAGECTRLGIPFGVYLYSYADSADKARSEAAHVLRLIRGYRLSYPVYLDLEQPGTERGAVERARIFGDIIEGAGYWCGVYANLNWWENYLPGLDRFTKWVAQYYRECEYGGPHLDIWQYTSSGKINGISGGADMNVCYRDFPAEILGTADPRPEEKTEYAADFSNSRAGVYRVRANGGLNLRTGASTDKPILETLADGAAVCCYGYHTGPWLYVEVPGGKRGFCHGDYLVKV